MSFFFLRFTILPHKEKSLQEKLHQFEEDEKLTVRERERQKNVPSLATDVKRTEKDGEKAKTTTMTNAFGSNFRIFRKRLAWLRKTLLPRGGSIVFLMWGGKC